MSEINDFIVDFKKKFRRLKGKSVALYGTGITTEWVCLYASNFFSNIEIYDLGKDYKEFHGVCYHNIDEGFSPQILIIMNRNPEISNNIYLKISKYVNIKSVYTLSTGKKIKKQKVLNKKKDFVSKTVIEKEILWSDSISFDIFDTVVSRKIDKPGDVYDLLGLLVKDKFDEINSEVNFTDVRKKAESTVTKKLIYPTFDDIYNEISNLLNLSTKTVELLKQTELELELSLLTPRDDVLDLLKFAYSNKKNVYFLSDMYFTKNEIIKIFDNLSIPYIESNIFVSSEIKASKEDGRAFKFYKKNVNGKRLLHVGDNYISDYKNARRNKIKSVLIPNPEKQIDQLQFQSNKNIYTKIKLGLFKTSYANSPFSGNSISTFQDYGYQIIGPIIFDYLFWIFLNTKNEVKDIFFFSRDGYFLKDLYLKICESFKSNQKVTYMQVSRAFLMYINSFEENNIKDLNFHGTIKDLLKYRFNLTPEDSKDLNRTISLPDDNVNVILSEYKSRIAENIKREKKLYLDYLESIGFNTDNMIIVYPSYKGTTQKLLAEISGKKTVGYYCYADLSEDNPNSRTINMKALFQNEDDLTASNSFLYRYHYIFESSFMVSPNGSLLGFDENGSFNFTPLGKTQLSFDNKQKTYDGVYKYFNDILEIITQIDVQNLEISKEVSVNIWECFCKNKIQISELIKNSLFMDNFYDKISDISVF